MVSPAEIRSQVETLRRVIHSIDPFIIQLNLQTPLLSTIINRQGLGDKPDCHVSNGMSILPEA